MTGGRGYEQRGVLFFVFQFGQELLFEFDVAAEIDFDAEFHGQQFGHFGIELGVDVQARDGAEGEQFAQHPARRHADRLGEGPDGAGQFHDDVVLSRRGRVRSGPADAAEGLRASSGLPPRRRSCVAGSRIAFV